MDTYKITIDEQEYTLNETDLAKIDVIETSQNHFHVLQNNQAYAAILEQVDFANKTMMVNINGNKYKLKIEDKYDQLIKQMGLSSANTFKFKEVKAPMPGLVLDILVKVDQVISKGDALLILEAMKMENVLKAEGDGVIKSIEVTKGSAVDKGQIIIEMK